MENTELIEEITEGNLKPGVREAFLEKLTSKSLPFGMKVLLCILIFLIGSKLIGLVRKMLRKSMEKAGAEEGVRSFVDFFVKVTLYVLLVFFLMSFFGVDKASIMVLVGAVGVAIVNNQVVVLPNGSLANTSLTNASGNKDRRMDVKIGISYKADLKKAKEVLLSLVEENEKVLKDREYRVFVDELADSAVILNMRCYFAQEVFWEEKLRMTENAKLALDAAGIEIAYPQLDVHVRPER